MNDGADWTSSGILDRIDIMQLAAEFANRSQTRRALFGRGHW